MCEIDAAAAAVEDLEPLSFYGLHHWSTKLNGLLGRAEDARLSKKPLEEEQELMDRKDEIVQLLSQLKRHMGLRLQEGPSQITKRELPIAEEFLQSQLTKLQRAKADDARVQRAVEGLQSVLDTLRGAKRLRESRSFQLLEVESKKLDIEWKVIYPLYDKWEAGRHVFKTNSELQAMTRRYKDCEKGRESIAERIEQALIAKNDMKGHLPLDPKAPAPGWSSANKGAPGAFGPGPRSTAKARAAADRKWDDKPPPQPSKWGVGDMTFAQRMQANIAAQVRDGTDGQEAEAPPEDEVAAPAAVAAAAPRPSAKKKGKAAKKKAGKVSADVDDEDIPAPAPTGPKANVTKAQAAAWATSAEQAIAGSVLQELLRPTTWSVALEGQEADDRFEDLCSRLALTNPLGFALPLEWKQFAGLEMDGGPKSTSKRHDSPGVERIQSNVGFLLGHYISAVFFLTLLHALSNFSVLLLPMVLQVGMLLAPPDVEQLTSRIRILTLQAAHALVWVLFVRAAWQMHVFVKLLAVAVVVGHAYCVKPVSDD